jgi:GDPmannose 4,6-dehydratase
MRSLIWGIPGQDSWFLSKLLLERGDEVIGCHRQSYTTSFPDFEELGPIKLRSCDLNDPTAVNDIITELKPDEVYNLAAHSFVADSFNRPAQIVSNNIVSHINLLEAVRHNSPSTKIYYAGSSEEIYPTSPYGVSKAAVKSMNDIYRKFHSLFIVHAQNFNHSSWRHSPKFLFGKVAKHVATLKKWTDRYNLTSTPGRNIVGCGKDNPYEISCMSKLELGYLGAHKDILYAEDVMRAGVLLMSQRHSGTTKVASGELTVIEDIVKHAFRYIGLDYKDCIITNTVDLLRPAESIPEIEECLYLRSLGWRPTMTVRSLMENTIDEYIKRGVNGKF